MRQIWKNIENKPYKKCRSCLEWLPATLEYYFKHTQTTDKLRSECRKCQGKTNEIYRNIVKKEILKHYGEKCSNSTCNIKNIWLLTIDHINNDGAKHRRLINNLGGYSFYLWLKRNKFPKGYQTLCWNCNSFKEFHKRLPDYTKEA